MEICFWNFSFWWRLKEYIRYLDEIVSQLLHMLFLWIMKREIPVEVALIYNTSYTRYFFLRKQYQYTKEKHLQGFRTGLTRSLKKYADLEC
jgi:DNA gyrase subunit B